VVFLNALFQGTRVEGLDVDLLSKTALILSKQA
jgi:hypothetical protein